MTMHYAPFIPYAVGVGVAACVAIPFNLVLSFGVEQRNPKDRVPKRLVVTAYIAAIVMLVAAMYFGGTGRTAICLGSIVVMELCAAAVLPLTVWRFCVVPKDRRRR